MLTTAVHLAHQAVDRTGGMELALDICSAAVVGVACVVYFRGLRRIWPHAQGQRRHRWRAVALVSAVVILLAISLPPLGELMEERLSTHMAQHMIYIMVVAPLLAVAAPGQPFLAGLPGGFRHRVLKVVRRFPVAVLLAPHVAWTLQIAALWLWHLPAAYDAALGSPVVHELEHFCFLTTAWLFWWHIVSVSRRRLRGPAALVYITAAMLPGAALGALLVFAANPLYPAQAASATASGVNALTDQRIGGLVMWIPLDYVYLVVAVVLFARWFKSLQPPESPESQLPPSARAGLEVSP